MSETPDLSVGGRRVMMKAKRLARDHRHDFITTEHLLLSILECDRIPKGLRVMQKCGVNLDEFRSFVISNLSKYAGSEIPELSEIEPSGRVMKVLSFAGAIAREMDTNLISIDHILMSILVSDSGSGNNLFKLKNIDVDDLYEKIYSGVMPVEKSKKRTKQRASGSSADQETDGTTHYDSVLEKYAVNLTELAMTGKLEPVIGREDSVQDMIQVLCRRTKNNPILLGEPGVGKTAVVEQLAHRIVHRDVPVELRDKQIYTLDLASLVAGTIYRGQFEERLKEVITYVQQHSDILIFIDEIHMLVGAGSTTGSMDASNILKPSLARGTVTCIGATTTQEYKEFIEGDGALERRFQEIHIDEPDTEQVADILKGIKYKYEEHHNVKYNMSVVKEIVRLCDRYLPDKNFPDKAIDILDELGSRAKINRFTDQGELKELKLQLDETVNHKNKAVSTQQFDLGLAYRETESELILQIEDILTSHESNQNKPLRLCVDDVRDLISMRCGVPVYTMEEQEAGQLSRLEHQMQTQVCGQDDSIKRICSAIKRNRAGVSDPNKPICSLLFLGPTGVGKTHLARVIGEQMFHDDQFKQFDMSEFGERHTVSKLIGSPPGYVGYGEGGVLTEYVRANPYCVLLFDEIEKAHPDVLQVFLQLMEYGVLTDSEGLEVNFKNTIVVMTSNIGAHKFEKRDAVGFAPRLDVRESVVNELKKAYAPEFINRIDEVVVFNKLQDDHLKKICGMLLKSTKKTLKSNTGITLMYDDHLIEFILNLDRDTTYGARPLRRLIVEHVETPLAEHIITRESDAKRIAVSIVDGQIMFNDAVVKRKLTSPVRSA